MIIKYYQHAICSCILLLLSWVKFLVKKPMSTEIISSVKKWWLCEGKCQYENEKIGEAPQIELEWTAKAF